MNVQLRLAAGMAVAVLVLGVAATGAGAIVTAVRGYDNVNRTMTSIAQLDGAFEGLLDAETAQRGYLLTQDPAYLEPLKHAERDLDPALVALEGIADTPAAKSAVARLATDARARLALVTASIAVADSTGFAAANALVRAGTGKHAMDDIRRQIGEIRRAAMGALDGQSRHDRGQLRFGLYIIVGGSALGFLFSLFVSLSIGRIFSERESVRRELVVTADELRVKAEALVVTAEEKESVRRELMVTAEEKESVRRELMVTAEEKESVRRQLLLTAEELRVKAEALDQHQRELGQLLVAEQRLSAQLNLANQELDQFAYATSHDLKAPLRGIMNLTGWIEEDLGEIALPKVRENLALIHGRAKRLEALIEGILAYARAGRLRAEPEQIDTRVLLDELTELLAPPPNVHIELVAPLPCFVAERVPLQQIFMNLIQNAIKHGCRSGGTVTVSAREEEHCYRFSVGDTGPGIAPEYHARVFGIFETLVTRDQVEGSGIGLSVVKKLVEARGQTVTLESVPGQGATFSFSWPRL